MHILVSLLLFLSNPMFDMINQYRSNNGIHSLISNPQLERISLNKSQEMYSRNYFGHLNPEGKMFYHYLSENGIYYTQAGENLAWVWCDNCNHINRAFNLLVNSPPHNSTMLNPIYRELGVGVKGDKKKTYFSMLFLAK